MRLLRSAFTITLILLSYSIIAQTGMVKFSINPGHNYEIKINQDSIVSVREMELPAGRHELQIWAPTYNMIDTAVTVVAGQEQTLLIQLARSSEWLAWDTQYREDRKKRIPLTIVSSTIGVAGIVFGGIKYNQYRQSHLTNLDLVERYENAASPSTIVDIKQDLDDNLLLTKKSQRGAVVGTLAGVVGLVGMIYFNKKIDVHEVPDWEDKQGLRFHDLSYQYFPEQSGGFHGLSLTLKF
jgi:hypothetical protein